MLRKVLLTCLFFGGLLSSNAHSLAPAPKHPSQKRKEFEDQVRRVGRWNPTVWVKYAQWEEQQKDFRRARSVWERAMEVDYRWVQ
jgi:hypothetical protein